MGGQIWLDPAIKLTHMGMKAFTGDPCSIYEEPDVPIRGLEVA